ncbi:30S ribosomal protein S6 [Acidomonas methanolica]|uniref:Small ribosomal subunit protein bS6 n=2 Tax=Acidomonas methanolica TaxID=437 RepID=A0A023D4A6_ACIMT|nr:30S ribosomal protein S6 [Acidomonas methanolica]TCS31686.1 SSU ribosomal protein S6P [Acidomonas methanolica]GAJ28899.1 30S ribosomal protein S6 [Acidomonas methanolica NBRC 104435]GEK98103.1 30S ribosomal protein S6 [Acidomonas methanolica NBRC 104435]
MPLYESVLIARNDVSQTQVETIVTDIETLLAQDGGVIEKREFWGLRSLAYRIKKNRKGHYVLLGLNARPDQIREMERQLGLNEDILRVLTLRVDEIDPNPSAILSRKGEDRGDRAAPRGVGGKPAGRFDSGRGDDREEFRARGEREDADLGVE